MTDQPSPLTFSHEPQLAEGDVALVFKKTGDIIIQHNVASVIKSGKITGGVEGAGFVMALAALELISDEAAYAQAMRDTAARLVSIDGPPTSGAVN